MILDNLSTHKPKRDRWLAENKNVHFPLHADARFLAQPERVLVQNSSSFCATQGELHLARRPAKQGNRSLYHCIQPDLRPVRMDECTADIPWSSSVVCRTYAAKR